MVGKVSWLAGVTSYQTHDYVTAARYIQAAKDKGFTVDMDDDIVAACLMTQDAKVLRT